MTDLARQVRGDFPILTTKVGDNNLVYFDNAATTQKPLCVIDAITDFYKTSYANIHRGVYELSEKSSYAYENARAKVAKFLNVASSKEIIFTRGTTESINLVASALNGNSVFASQNRQVRVDKGDEILLSELEHHANLIPWQRLCAQTGAKLKFIPVLPNGELDLSNIDELINNRTKILAIAQVSNTLGSINPIKILIDKIHAKNGLAFIDGAQAIAHEKIDLGELNADFYAFSGHKIYAPTGIGVLYGKAELLQALPVWQTGGDMIEKVDFTTAIFADIPHKFEAGTTPIVEAYGLGVALDYLTAIGMDNIANSERALLDYATEQVNAKLPDINIIGTSKHKTGIISFVLKSGALNPQDMGILLNEYGIAIRTGHHCTMPLLTKLNIGATARVSFGMYNTCAEVDIWIDAMREIIKRFAL